MRKGHLPKVFPLSDLFINQEQKAPLKKYKFTIIPSEVFITKLLRFRYFKITLYGLFTLFEFIRVLQQKEDREGKRIPLSLYASKALFVTCILFVNIY